MALSPFSHHGPLTLLPSPGRKLLQPENILMDADCKNLKIADFGLAAIVSPFSSSLGASVGTPEFAAPEIIAGKQYEGAGVDIWSMGVILYELTVGELPFRVRAPRSGLACFRPVPLVLFDSAPRVLCVDPPSACMRACLQGESQKEMFVKIQKGSIAPFPPWIPESLKDLVKRMLTVSVVST